MFAYCLHFRRRNDQSQKRLREDLREAHIRCRDIKSDLRFLKLFSFLKCFRNEEKKVLELEKYNKKKDEQIAGFQALIDSKQLEIANMGQKVASYKEKYRSVCFNYL